MTTMTNEDPADPSAHEPTANVGDVVWFRLGRMHGYPPQQPMRARVTALRGRSRVDLELQFDQGSGTAAMVSHIDTLPDALKEQQACWWSGNA